MKKSNNGGMLPIETNYNGILFRSRLEARWAMFFDLIQARWNYEPEGFTNGDDSYLPDFVLYNVALRDESSPLYIEIKPESFTQDRYKEWFTKNLVLFNGTPRQFIWDNNTSEGGFQQTPYWDNCMRIWKCVKCGRMKIEFSEGHYNRCIEGCDGKSDDAWLLRAAILADSARFNK